ncbi:MAG: DUF1385 domain-containing protein [Clostridia bacterium]|nr:DUF1385 domain-containing protein [Clostridia bacterium]
MSRNKEKKDKNQAPGSGCAMKTSIGGQALLEGVMMRGPKKSALSVRNPEGQIVSEVWETQGVNRPKVFKLPIIRGIFNFYDSLKIGYKCLMRSAEISTLDAITKDGSKDKKNEENPVAASDEQSAQAQEVSEVVQDSTPEEKVVLTGAEPVLPESGADLTESEKTEPEAASVSEEVKTEDREGGEDGKGDAKSKSNLRRMAQDVKEEEKLSKKTVTIVMVIAVVLALALAIGLFVVAPTAAARGILSLTDWDNESTKARILTSVVEGIIKVILLVGYVAAVGLEKDIRRVYQYHGAEHKTIFCYESGLPLTVENVKKMRRFHPRCGTSFMILMVLVSIVIGFFIPRVYLASMPESWLNTLIRVAIKILLIPFTVGIGYELLKFAGRHDNILTKIISAPGILLQHITVYEPEDDMIECAIRSVELVIPEDGSDRILSRKEKKQLEGGD